MALNARDVLAGAALGGGVATAVTLGLIQRYVHRELAHPLLLHKSVEECEQEKDRELLQEVKLLLRDYWPHPILEFSGAISTAWSGFWAVLPTTVHPGHVEELALEDGGTVSLHWSEPPIVAATASSHKGIVLLLPGLNNDSRTSFVQSSMQHLRKDGYHAVALNIRGSGGLRLTSPRIGCADSWRDFNEVIDHLEMSQPGAPIYAMGFSMGGGMLLRYVGEEGPRCRLKGAITIAAPGDFNAVGGNLESTLKKRVTNFVMTSGVKMSMGHQMLSDPTLAGSIDRRGVLRATSLRQLEEASICPMHGYRDAEDYYTQNNPKFHLQHIAVPTLIVNAADDPVISFKTLPLEEIKRNPRLFLAITRRGGHIGWTGGGLGSTAWTDRMASEFMRACGAQLQRQQPQSKL